MNTRLDQALQRHRSVADAYAALAAAVPGAVWNEPLAERKWSPAEVTLHLITVYDVLTRELYGGPGMRVVTPWWMRIWLRLYLVPRLLAGGAFPARAPAPREVRPREVPLDRDSSRALFRRRSEEFEAAVRAAPSGQRITHAYFGGGSVLHGVQLCARHIEHHAEQIRPQAKLRAEGDPA